MKREEIERELSMSYNELVDYLLKKYGKAEGDYFVSESCKTRNKKIARTQEGLVIHHIDEDKAIMLSNTKFAVANPFEYQKADRLVYCNILEHLILHIKIMEEPKPEGANSFEIQGIGGAIGFICPQLNDFYNGYEFKREVDKIKLGLVADNFEDYINVLHYLKDVAKQNPRYSFFASDEKLASGFNGQTIDKIYDRL